MHPPTMKSMVFLLISLVVAGIKAADPLTRTEGKAPYHPNDPISWKELPWPCFRSCVRKDVCNDVWPYKGDDERAGVVTLNVYSFCKPGLEYGGDTFDWCMIKECTPRFFPGKLARRKYYRKWFDGDRRARHLTAFKKRQCEHFHGARLDKPCGVEPLGPFEYKVGVEKPPICSRDVEFLGNSSAEAGGE